MGEKYGNGFLRVYLLLKIFQAGKKIVKVISGIGRCRCRHEIGEANYEAYFKNRFTLLLNGNLNAWFGSWRLKTPEVWVGSGVRTQIGVRALESSRTEYSFAIFSVEGSAEEYDEYFLLSCMLAKKLSLPVK